MLIPIKREKWHSKNIKAKTSNFCEKRVTLVIHFFSRISEMASLPKPFSSQTKSPLRNAIKVGSKIPKHKDDNQRKQESESFIFELRRARKKAAQTPPKAEYIHIVFLRFSSMRHSLKKGLLQR